MSERIIVYLFFVAFVLVGLWGGSKGVSYANDYAFYYSYLKRWQSALSEARFERSIWSGFGTESHFEYMRRLTSKLDAQFVHEMGSVETAFLYRLESLGGEVQNAFLLARPDKIYIYGLNEETVEHLDAFIDPTPDLGRGDFKAKPGRDNKTYNASWSY